MSTSSLTETNSAHSINKKSSAHHYKVYIKSEEVQWKNKRSDSWAVTVSEAPKKESECYMLLFLSSFLPTS